MVFDFSSLGSSCKSNRSVTGTKVGALGVSALWGLLGAFTPQFHWLGEGWLLSGPPAGGLYIYNFRHDHRYHLLFIVEGIPILGPAVASEVRCDPAVRSTRQPILWSAASTHLAWLAGHWLIRRWRGSVLASTLISPRSISSAITWSASALALSAACSEVAEYTVVPGSS